MDEQGEWLTLQLASQKLGTSVQTLRRKVKAGKVKSRQVETVHGLAYEVWVVTDYPSLERVGWEASPKAESAESLDIQALLHKLQDENSKLHQEVMAKAEAASLWQGRAEVLSLQLGQAQETIKALEAPKVMEVEGMEESQSLSWWRSWWQKLTISSD